MKAGSWFGRTPRVKRPVDCAEVGRVLQHFLDAQLSEADADVIAQHLDACRMCGLEAEAFRALQRSLRYRQPMADATVERLRTFARELGATEERQHRDR